MAYDTPSPKLLSFLQKHYGESGPECRHCLLQASWLCFASLYQPCAILQARPSPADILTSQGTFEPEQECALQALATACHRITGLWCSTPSGSPTAAPMQSREVYLPAASG